MQEGCDVELVVVDDGNEQSVRELLADVADARVRHLRLEHGGVARARNAGLAAARGPFLRYVDADDVAEPGSTRRLLDLLGGRTDRVSYGATLYCDEQLRPMWRMTSRMEGRLAEATLRARCDPPERNALPPRGGRAGR